MRTSITNKELQTFTFPMTDKDVLARVDEVNELNSQEANLNTKKALIQKEIKQLQADQSFKLNCISRREEPREVECDVIFDYENRTIQTLFEGEEMASRRMSDWEYSCRPEDIYPDKKKTTVEGSEEETTLDQAMDRAQEIATKEENMTAPSANVKAHSEAKTEQSVVEMNP